MKVLSMILNLPCGLTRHLGGHCASSRGQRRLPDVIGDGNTLTELVIAGGIGWQWHTLVQLSFLCTRQAWDLSEHLDNILVSLGRLLRHRLFRVGSSCSEV